MATIPSRSRSTRRAGSRVSISRLRSSMLREPGPIRIPLRPRVRRRSARSCSRIASPMACPMFSDAIGPLTRTSACSSSGADIRPPTSCSTSPSLPKQTCAPTHLGRPRCRSVARVRRRQRRQVPARGKLGEDLGILSTADACQLALGFGVERIERQGDGLVVFERAAQNPARARAGRSDHGLHRSAPRSCDDARASAGSRSMARELPGARADDRSEPAFVRNGPAARHKELSHPEPNYFAVGIKSYGRAPTFLMATGYEQVRSVAASLAGDRSRRERGSPGSSGNRRLLCRISCRIAREQRMLRRTRAGECRMRAASRTRKRRRAASRLRLRPGGSAESRRELRAAVARPGVGRP